MSESNLKKEVTVTNLKTQFATTFVFWVFLESLISELAKIYHRVVFFRVKGSSLFFWVI